MKKFHRQLSDLSNPMPTDLDPESFMSDAISSNASSNASDHESDHDLAVDHYIPVG